MAITTKQIKGAMERINSISNEAVLTPSEIVGIVNNKAILPSVFTLYRFIKRGSIKSVNLGTESEPRYHVKGSEIKKFYAERFGEI